MKYSVVVSSNDKTILAVNGDQYTGVRSLNSVNGTKYGQAYLDTFEKISFINIKTILKGCVLTHKRNPVLKVGNMVHAV